MVDSAKLERLLQIEHDGFIKTSLVAYVANYFAHNITIPLDRIVAKCMQLAELSWEAMLEERKKSGL